MAYNAQNATEQQTLKGGLASTGIITHIQDGTVGAFITETGKATWKGEMEQPAINVTVETNYRGTTYKFEKLFTYRLTEDKTVYTTNSNLGKYHKRYGKLPETGDQITCVTNSEGFWEISM